MDSKPKVSKKRIAFQISQSLRDELKSEALKCSMSLDKFIENALEKKVSGFFGQGAGAGRVYLQQAGMREEARKAEAFEQGVFRGGAARSVREARGGVFWKRVKSGHIWDFACARERSPWASIGRKR